MIKLLPPARTASLYAGVFGLNRKSQIPLPVLILNFEMIYEVVHTTAGRCRIRIPRLRTDSTFGKSLRGIILSLHFVDEVRINHLAKSLIISYAVDMGNAEEYFVSCIHQAQMIGTNPELGWEGEGSDIRADLSLPFLSLSLAILAAPLEISPLIVSVAIAGAAIPWFYRAMDGLVHNKPNIDMLDCLWITFQTLRGEYIAPALKTSLTGIRQNLRHIVTEEKTQKALELLTFLNQEVVVKYQGWEKTLPARELRAGDCLLLSAGQIIPVDGQIISGRGLVNCYPLTGLATPVSCSTGDEIYASCILVAGELSVLVKRTGHNTRIGLAAEVMLSDGFNDLAISSYQAEFAKNAIFPTVLLGCTIFALTGNLGPAISPFQLNFGSGVSITTSTTVRSALTHAAYNGIYMPSGRTLETLAKVDTLVIDYSMLGNHSLSAISLLQGQGIAIYWHNYDPSEPEKTTLQPFGSHDHYQQLVDLRELGNQGRTIAVVGKCGYFNPVFACADLRISLATEDNFREKSLGSDMVLLDHDLWGLTIAIALAKQAMTAIYQNTAIIVIPNLLSQIGGGMFLGINPTWNVIVNNSSAFIAEFLNISDPTFPVLLNRSRSEVRYSPDFQDHQGMVLGS